MPGALLGTNYQMNEMVGVVMGPQLKKPDTILDALRQRARAVRDRIRELPGIEVRPVNYAEGEVGVAAAMSMPSKERRDQFVAAMKAKDVVMSPPSAAVVLTVAPYIENKVSLHLAWPTLNTPRGKEIRYGAECCPRTLDLFQRTASSPSVRNTARRSERHCRRYQSPSGTARMSSRQRSSLNLQAFW